MKNKVLSHLKKYSIYYCLLTIFVAIRVIPVSISNDIDKAINDIAIGGFASTLVALLLQMHNDYAKANVVRKTEKKLFEDLLIDISGYYMFCIDWLSNVCRVDADTHTPKEISFFVNEYQNKYPNTIEVEFERVFSRITAIYESLQAIDKVSSLFIIQEGISDDAIRFINELKQLFTPAYLFASVDSINDIVKSINNELPTILSTNESTKDFAENPIIRANLDDRLFVCNW